MPYLLYINLTSNSFDSICSTMTMVSLCRSSLMMFKEVLYNLENLLRILLYLILVPVAIFGTLASMAVKGLAFVLLHLLIVLMENTVLPRLLVNNTNQLMAELNLDELDMEDFEEGGVEIVKSKIGAGKKGRNARRRKNKMQAAAKRLGKEKDFEGKGDATENLEKVKVDPKPDTKGEEGQIVEKTKGLRIKLSQLEKEERMEKDALGNLEEETKKALVGSKRSNAKKNKLTIIEVAQKKSLEAKRLESMEKLAKIQDEIKTVRWELKAAESGAQAMSKDLEAFLEREIKELEDELECPVCLEVAKTAPIYKCEDDHLICRF